MHQLEYCKKCTKRKFDPSRGIVCSLTNEKPTFQDTCPDYEKDDTLYELPKEEDSRLQINALKSRLSSESLQQLKDEQRLIPGIIAGLVVGIIGAFLWGVLTVAMEFQIGYMALAIGAGVGYAIRIVGRGVHQIYGFWGAGIALFSVALGNFLSIAGFIGQSEGLGLFETLMLLDYTYVPELMVDFFSLIDLLFYAIATFEGYKFSFRVLDAVELSKMSK